MSPFILNFLLFPVVEEFWKSVEIWLRYRHEFSGTFLCGHGVYYFDTAGKEWFIP